MRIKFKNNLLLALGLVSSASLLPTSASADVRLPKLIGDGMVLQRDAAVKIWGWADPGEEISITFANASFSTETDKSGKWQVALPKLQPGGPYRMQIQGDNRIEVENILVGDVWLASGQSNMEYPMSRVAHHYPQEMQTASNSEIRQFQVPQRYDFKAPQEDLSGGEWKSVNRENLPEFSAVAYFFAKQIHAKEQVPIGILNTSLGGSPAEAWVSEETLKQFPQHYKELQRFKDDSLIKKIESTDRKHIEAWYREIDHNDSGYKRWNVEKLDTSDWQTMTVPGYWADTELGRANGVVWFRKIIDVPESMAGKPATLVLGRMVDADTTYVNGKKVGNTTYLYPRRRYTVPAGVLKKGENSIAIRLINSSGRGGFVPDKSYALISGEQRLDLRGQWQYRLGARMEPLGSQTFVRWKPTGLYNAMIHPLNNYRIKGALWYQGESNVGRAKEYKKLFPAMINNWREDRQQPFPFLFVQLANFQEAKATPTDSEWARLREAQASALALPHTGMVTAIDLGEWNDIHPLDKKSVGDRLALGARKIAYGEKDLIASGPTFKSVRKKNNRLELNFDQSGLEVRGESKLSGFAIAGEDKKFVWANALIDGGKVVVWSDEVTSPVAVRYAWADNPDSANLYNREGLPAAPFRTDDW